MKKGENRQEQGFTIIEVSLVLAIAGLIFLMTFVALPALQRSSRDTQRKEAITLLVDAIKKYQSNNRGALPETTTGENNDWDRLATKYLSDTNFTDPSTGQQYTWEIADCGNGASGEACDGNNSGLIRTVVTEASSNGRMVIVRQAKCAGDETVGAVRAANPRKFAVLMRLEGGGVYCEGA